MVLERVIASTTLSARFVPATKDERSKKQERGKRNKEKKKKRKKKQRKRIRFTVVAS